MNVELIAYTPDPEKVVATAAKLCYSSANIAELKDNLTEDNISKFVTMLSSMGHESPFEHITFTFGIEGVSRSLTHQLVRHRIASYSQKSQRYVSENDFEYIMPKAIADSQFCTDVFNDTMKCIKDAYRDIESCLTKTFTQQFLDSGLDEKTANNKAKRAAAENARAVLPNACETKIIVTMNARSLFNFFNHRCCNRAQDEIRKLATEMYKLVYKVAPNIFKNAGPTCVSTGHCPEGKMTCGKMIEMRKTYTLIREELSNEN
jgi:thymidylate synthase (FAD)